MPRFLALAIDTTTGCGTFSDLLQLSDTAVGVAAYEVITGLRIYPNPAVHSITFELPQDEEDASIFITNLSGQQVAFYDVSGRSGEIEVPVNDLAGGVYFYRYMVSGLEMSSGQLIVAP